MLFSHEGGRVGRPVTIVLGNSFELLAFEATSCGSSNLEQVFTISATFEQNMFIECLSTSINLLKFEIPCSLVRQTKEYPLISPIFQAIFLE